MLNNFGLICICFNSALSLSSFLFANRQFFSPIVIFFSSIVNFYVNRTSTLFSISLCLASCGKFSMRFEILSLKNECIVQEKKF